MKNNKKTFVSPELTICYILDTKDIITASGGLLDFLNDGDQGVNKEDDLTNW